MEEILNQIPPIIRLFFGVVGALVLFVVLPLVVIRGVAGWLTMRPPDAACTSTYHNALVRVYGHCIICGKNTPRR